MPKHNKNLYSLAGINELCIVPSFASSESNSPHHVIQLPLLSALPLFSTYTFLKKNFYSSAYAFAAIPFQYPQAIHKPLNLPLLPFGSVPRIVADSDTAVDILTSNIASTYARIFQHLHHHP